MLRSRRLITIFHNFRAGWLPVADGPGWLVLILAALWLQCPAELLGEENPGDGQRQTAAVNYFETHIRPVLARKCIKCHGESKQEGGLRLDSHEAILQGGESGPAVSPGQIEESQLILALRHESFEMPPTGKLPDSVIGQFEHWVTTGAVWPADLKQLRHGSSEISEEDRQWWAFQPIRKADVPAATLEVQADNAIDRFVGHRLQQAQLQQAPQASRMTLIRRLYFNLIGLPPAPEEIDAFVQDDSPEAWSLLVNRLLDDPRYGEHWARFWLDLVRFAESDGWNKDSFRPDLWRYRDYVVNAFNNDKPYPDFVREQLAGDEIGEDNPQHLAAVGFLRLGIYEYNQRDARGQWNDIINEMTDVTADVFLGMGMSCARCHDHKFDPILQSDYFRLRAFFEPIVWRDDVVAATADERAANLRQQRVWEAATQGIRDQIDALLKPYFDRKWKSTVEKFPLEIQDCFHKPVEQRTSWEHQMAYLISRQFLEEGNGPLASMKKEDKAAHEALEQQLAAFDHLKPSPLATVMTVSDFEGAISPTVIPDLPEQTDIAPGILTVLRKPESVDSFQIPAVPNSTGRRMALAQWIGRDDNPLTNRVIVNRIWQQHFGQGLVPTASDFGHQGLPPTHPELLDWLTTTFIENGWSIKELHRQILTSATWQQSAIHPHAHSHQAADPADSLLWRSRVRRLKAEQIRDAMLACSGELLAELGGPSVDASVPRRAIYVKGMRNTPDPFLYAFDIANGLQSISERGVTTTPIQSLLMINGQYPLERAKKMAERLAEQSFSTPQDLLNYAFQLTWGRKPTEFELESALTSVGIARDGDVREVDSQNLADFCHVLFNSGEFLYVD